MPRISRKFQTNTAEVSKPDIHIYKTAVYTRLSVEDIRKKASDAIATQKTMLIKFLQSQPDMQLYDTYEDNNYTGTNFNRPGFAKMIEDINAGLVDCVLVKDLSRFGRSFEETGHYLERVFPSLQVRFIAIGDNLDSLTATLDESNLMVPLKNLMNEIYARDISKKTQSGFKAKQQRGEFCGSFAPYGYIKEGPRLVIDEAAAAVVKQIYAWRLEGTGIAAIVKKLNRLQFLPPSKHRFQKGITKSKKHDKSQYWYASAVKRVLSNPLYTGNLAQGRYKSSFLMGGGATVTNENEWVIFKNTHPPIITQEIFEAVRNMREYRKKEFLWDTGNHIDNIFKGLLVCGDCGKHMARQRRREKFVFECYVHKSINSQACTHKLIREIDLHNALYAYIKHAITLAADMHCIIAGLQRQEQNKQNIVDKQIDTLKRRLEQNRWLRRSLREDLKDGILTEHDYVAMKAAYDDEKDKLQLNLDEIAPPDNKWTAEFRRFESEQQLSAKMASTLVERIKVYKDKRIEVFLRFRDELVTTRHQQA